MSASSSADHVGTELVAYDTNLWPELLDQNPDAVRERFARRFMQAETVEDLFNVLKGNSSQDMVGQTVKIDAVAWAPYESDRGIIPLAICQATNLKTGELIEFATTSEMLCMFIRRAELIGGMPFAARITEKLTRSGQKALNFEPV